MRICFPNINKTSKWQFIFVAGENLVGEGAGLFEEPPSEVAPPQPQHDQSHLQHQRPGTVKILEILYDEICIKMV